ncbi:lipocalin family protein, partial [Phenylobacterium sp.]|uniref:lipocalin family protein n=1 Tax=Phenylobacterium sp. TaxID=1871053 RepID=UPI002DE681BF|nr:lipocalin family protein [Phenylobacterium sp.]
MFKRLLSAAALSVCAVAASAQAAPPAVTALSSGPAPRIELTQMMGRWYEVARIPNQLQKGCQGGTSDWTRNGEGFAVIQACHKGKVDGPVSEWKARARSLDPVTNSLFKMSFFGGLVSKEYRVLDHHAADGWLILATDDGHYLWLMSQKPVMAAPVRAQALAKIKSLGFDVGRLEFP